MEQLLVRFLLLREFLKAQYWDLACCFQFTIHQWYYRYLHVLIVFSMLMMFSYIVGYHSQRKTYLLEVQSDIDELEKWSKDQLLQMNPSIYIYMIMSKKHKVNSNVGVLLRLENTIPCIPQISLGEI